MVAEMKEVHRVMPILEATLELAAVALEAVKVLIPHVCAYRASSF